MKTKSKNWKLLMVLLVAGLSSVLIASCGEDEDKPKTIPVLTTNEPANVEFTSAEVSGLIDDDGNASITESGFVYSTVVSNPTITDDKEVVEAVDDEMIVVLDGLNSGTKYYVRAYATNSEGTGYGLTKEFTTGNSAPTATNVAITVVDELKVEQDLTADYDYVDVENNTEAASTYQWYRDDDGVDGGEVAIEDATTLTYTIQDEDAGKYIRFGVTPKAIAGTLSGVEAKSAFTLGVGEETEVTFTYRNNPVTYGIILSPVTGRKWLDRNLGASAAPNGYDDWENFGDVFQWGRLDDGHQVITRVGPLDSDASGSAVIGTTTDPQTSPTDIPGHAFFILNGSTSMGIYDWRNPQNDNLWQGVNGTNNPCPSGWRIPTRTEWEAETLTNLSAGYAQLKLTMTGQRTSANDTGPISGNTTTGLYWSSTEGALPTAKGAVVVRIQTGGAASYLIRQRASAYACRCIKD